MSGSIRNPMEMTMTHDHAVEQFTPYPGKPGAIWSASKLIAKPYKIVTRTP